MNKKYIKWSGGFATAASTWHTTYAGASYLGAVDVNVDTQ